MERESYIKECGGYVLKPMPCTNGALPQKLASAFYELFENWAGAGYTPLVYCGSQLVNGYNYMIICKQVSVLQHPVTSIAAVVLHETFPKDGGIMGEFSVLSIETLVQGGLEGGFNIDPFPYMPGELSHDPIHEAFVQINKKLTGSTLKPYAYGGTQVVQNGVNLLFVCSSTVTGEEEPNNIDLVVIGKDGDEYTLVSIEQIL